MGTTESTPSIVIDSTSSKQQHDASHHPHHHTHHRHPQHSQPMESHPDIAPEEFVQINSTFQELAERTHSTNVVTKETIFEYFHLTNYPTFSELFYKSICLEHATMTALQYRDIFMNYVRSHGSTPVQHIYDIIIHDTNLINEQNRIEMFFLILLEFANCNDDNASTSNAKIARDLSDYYFTCNNEKFDFITFNVTNLPCVSQVISSYFFTKLCPGRNNSRAYHLPQLSASSSIVTELSQIFPLTLYSPALQGRWILLFSSDIHGFSFNRIAHHVLGYNGPTCMLIKCAGGSAQGSIIGAYADSKWKDSNRFFGTSDTFLFSTSPLLRIYRSSSASNQSYQWLNIKTYGHEHGLGFGGTKEKFRLFIPESMENCQAYSSCPTFEPGHLIPTECKNTFEINTLEIWGCGGEEIIHSGLLAQQKDREIRDENIRKAKKVDKAAFFQSDFDKEMFLSNTFSHQKDRDERASPDA